MNAFRVYAADPTPKEIADLTAWSARHLAELEQWAVRRHVRIPAALLADVRRQFTETTAEPDFTWEEVAAGYPADRSRRSRFLATFERHLLLYATSLAEGQVNDLTVAITAGIPSACYAAGARRLYLPDWLVDMTTNQLFNATPLFPDPPSSTLSWLFFQSLVITPPGTATGPASHVLRIRESD